MSESNPIVQRLERVEQAFINTLNCEKDEEDRAEILTQLYNLHGNGSYMFFTREMLREMTDRLNNNLPFRRFVLSFFMNYRLMGCEYDQARYGFIDVTDSYYEIHECLMGDDIVRSLAFPAESKEDLSIARMSLAAANPWLFSLFDLLFNGAYHTVITRLLDPEPSAGTFYSFQQTTQG